MKIAVSAESTVDLSEEIKKEFDISVIPYTVILNDKTVSDGEVPTQEIFDFVEESGILPKTTALNEYEYREYFESLLKRYDAVVHIALSGEISSSCSNAARAAKSLSNVFVVDSRSLSTGIGLLALYARKLADEGMAPVDIYEKVQKRTAVVQASFVIERLDYLYKGGRCNSLQLLGANILKIRPRIVLKDGKMINDKKYKGTMCAVVEKYCNETLSDFNTPDLSTAFITYTTATPEMVAKAKDALTAAGFEKIYETHAGCTIASHCGANTLGILYFNDGDKI